MTRLYFDIKTKEEVVERDPTGVLVADKGKALSDCIENFAEPPLDDSLASVTVKDEDGDIIMILQIDTLLKPV